MKRQDGRALPEESLELLRRQAHRLRKEGRPRAVRPYPCVAPCSVLGRPHHGLGLGIGNLRARHAIKIRQRLSDKEARFATRRRTRPKPIQMSCLTET